MRTFSSSEFWRALLVGFIAAVATGATMIALMRFGVAPFPKQIALAFVETLLARPVPLPVGLLFHVAYVTFWGVAYVYLFRTRLTFLNAAWLALALWALMLVVFFPYVGWGLFGLTLGPKLIVGSFFTHALFALAVWLSARWLFVGGASRQTPAGHP